MSIEISRILFPTDYSELAQAALGHALAIAGAFKAEVHCLHVVDDAYQYWSALGPESIPIGPPREELLKLSQSRMTTFVEEHLGGLEPLPVTSVAIGRPFAEIIAYAREHDIDMIVMGTHGRGAIAHMLLGSTTEKVVRKAPCPVLTVRGPDQQFEMP